MPEALAERALLALPADDGPRTLEELE